MEGQLSYRKRPSQHNPHSRIQLFLHEFLMGSGFSQIMSSQRNILPITYEASCPMRDPYSFPRLSTSLTLVSLFSLPPTMLACTLLPTPAGPRPQWALPLISSLEYLSSKHLQSRRSHHLWVFAGVSLAGKPKSDPLICNADFPQIPICASLLDFSPWPLTPRDKTYVSLVYFVCPLPSFL